MERIKNFVLPENTNQLYKEEAISSIGLTREVAAKINELVDAYNSLSETDLKWKQTQEGIIRKGVLYMKDNLVNTLQSLYDLLQQQGFIDSRIRTHTAELTARVDNLLKNVPSGSTTMDAEIIDVRVGADGKTYSSAGNSVREQLSNTLRGITPIPTDADTLTKAGIYWCDDTANLPINSSGILMVFTTDPTKPYRVCQMFIPTKIYNAIYFRAPKLVTDGVTTWEEWNYSGFQNGEITTEIDIDTLTDHGSCYYLSSNSKPINFPPVNNKMGTLYVLKPSERYGYSVVQLVFPYESGEIWYRGCSLINGENVFDRWRKIATTEDIERVSSGASSGYYISKINDTSFYISQQGKHGIVRHYIYRDVDTEINMECWRWGKVELCNNDGVVEHLVTPLGADNEGVLRIAGEVDFLGGIHGDEKEENIMLFIDGVLTHPADLESGTASKIELFVSSSLTHANTSNECFKRNKYVCFDKDGIHIRNKWEALESVKLEVVYGGMLSSAKGSFTHYFDSMSSVFPLEATPYGEETGTYTVSNTFKPSLHFTGVMNASVKIVDTGSDEEASFVKMDDYGERIKAYCGLYKDHTTSVGEILYSESLIKIEY